MEQNNPAPEVDLQSPAWSEAAGGSSTEYQRHGDMTLMMNIGRFRGRWRGVPFILQAIENTGDEHQ
jgi:hypothetical protein